MLIKNNKVNTIQDYYKIIIDINNKYLNNDININTYVNTYNFIYQLIDKDNTITDNDKEKIYNLIKSLKRLSL
jgi:L-arabinose isomerase